MSTNFQYIDLSYLELMADDDHDMKVTMIEMLLSEIPEEIEKMQPLLVQENWKELREVSHKMKSTLAFVGNETMTEANKEIEEIAKSAVNVAALPDLINTLLDTYPKVLEELKAVEADI